MLSSMSTFKYIQIRRLSLLKFMLIESSNIPLMQKLVAFDQKDAAYLNVCEIIII